MAWEALKFWKSAPAAVHEPWVEKRDVERGQTRFREPGLRAAERLPGETKPVPRMPNTRTTSLSQNYDKIKMPHARGTSGEVSIAFHIGLGREVALKKMPRQRAEEAHHEFEVMQAYSAVPGDGLSHLAKPIEHFEQIGRHYIAMEVAPGATLADQVIGRKVAVAAIINAAIGLQHLHDAGYLHLDIKPANIMMVPGQPETLTVIDFGKAQKMNRRGFASPTGFTRGFAAPEVIGDCPANRSADVYSLAMTLRRLIGPVSLESELNAVIDRATQKLPANRYQTMTAFIAALRALP